MIQIHIKKQFPFIEIWKSLGKPVKGNTYSQNNINSKKDESITNSLGDNNTGSAKSISR